MAFHVLVKSLAGRFGRLWRITAVTAWVFAASLDATFAQSIASSALNGTVRDGTGGALPGVTVTITSPVSVPGISMVGVLKSGGNEFHGTAAAPTSCARTTCTTSPSVVAIPARTAFSATGTMPGA